MIDVLQQLVTDTNELLSNMNEHWKDQWRASFYHEAASIPFRACFCDNV